MSLRSLSIKAKLLSLILSASTACFAIVGAGLYLSYTRMYQDRVDSLRFMVEAGHSMATKLEAEVISGNLSRDEAQARFKQALSAIRYSGKEYLFANTYTGMGFVHPNEKLMGKDLTGVKDTNGIAIFPAMISIAKSKGEGTYTYNWSRAIDSKETAEKLTYVKGFEPWGIFIGTGVFIDDIWLSFMTQLWKILGVVALLAFPAIILLLLVGRNISNTIRSLAGKMRELAAGNRRSLSRRPIAEMSWATWGRRHRSSRRTPRSRPFWKAGRRNSLELRRRISARLWSRSPTGPMAKSADWPQRSSVSERWLN